MGRYVITFFLFALLMVSLFGCSSNEYSTKMPDDFDFTLSYGVNGVNQINTFEDKVVKDLISNGKIEAQIELSDNEMQQIYEKMIEIDIMKNFDVEKENGCEIIPSNLSKWTIQMNGETNTFYYKSYCNRPKRIETLYELEGFIHNIVENKEEYKRLPNAEGGYE